MIKFATKEAKDVQKFLEEQNAFWYWDNHLHVAQLTSGKFSDFFANCTPIFTKPEFQRRVGQMMAGLLRPGDLEGKNIWVIGSAMGAVGLAQAIAYELCVRAAFTEPIIEGRMELKRFNLGADPVVLICEDVMSTGTTTRKTIEAIRAKHPSAKIYGTIPVVVDRRMDQEVRLSAGGRAYEIKGLLNVKPGVWDNVSQLPDEMKNCVPIRPKGNWSKLQEKRDG